MTANLFRIPKGTAIVVGVVFKGGCSVDGVMHTHIAIDGFDATEQICFHD